MGGTKFATKINAMPGDCKTKELMRFTRTAEYNVGAQREMGEQNKKLSKNEDASHARRPATEARNRR